MTDADTSSGPDPGEDVEAREKDAKKAKKKRRMATSGKKIKDVVAKTRERLGSLVWIVAVVCALFLAVGALLVALEANQDNGLVTFILDGADTLDGPFRRQDGIFTFDGSNAVVKNALVNWGIAAIVYLVVGKIVDRVVSP